MEGFTVEGYDHDCKDCRCIPLISKEVWEGKDGDVSPSRGLLPFPFNDKARFTFHSTPPDIIERRICVRNQVRYTQTQPEGRGGKKPSLIKPLPNVEEKLN
jgi:hypothetical protein